MLLFQHRIGKDVLHTLRPELFQHFFDSGLGIQAVIPIVGADGLPGGGITTMRQLHEKISAMNKNYYDPRGKIVSAERRIKALDEHLSMWEQYEKNKSIRRQLDKVEPGKKGQFEQKHGTELALYEAAACYLEKLKSGGEAVTPKKWRAESEKLAAQKEIHYQEMRTMREQIKAVENLRKAADQLERSQQDRNRKKEDNQL